MELETQRVGNNRSLTGIINGVLYGVGLGMSIGICKNTFAGNVTDALCYTGAMSLAAAMTFGGNVERNASAPEHIVDTGIAVTASALAYTGVDFLCNYLLK